MIGFEATARIRRTGAVFSNLRAARYFAEQLKAHEDAHIGKEFGTYEDVAPFYFFASITASVATLEATYNTLIEDLDFDREEIEVIDKVDVLRKFWWLLKLRNKPPFDKSAEPAQSIKDLLTLRNFSVHYRPRWDDDAIESKKLEKQFRARNISSSPLTPEGMPFFPHRCCSHKYAEWATQSVEEFLTEFARRMDTDIKWLAT